MKTALVMVVVFFCGLLAGSGIYSWIRDYYDYEFQKSIEYNYVIVC